MKKIIIIFSLFFSAVVAMAQGDGSPQQKGDFNPKDFETHLEQYVVKEAGITKEEATKFLPIYREMRQKQIQTMEAERDTWARKATTEKEWETRMKAHDNTEIELKKIAQTYHNKMLSVIPASKIMKVVKAENDFHRDSFRQHVGNNPPPKK